MHQVDPTLLITGFLWLNDQDLSAQERIEILQTPLFRVKELKRLDQRERERERCSCVNL